MKPHTKENDMLKIGISACFFYPDPERTVFGHKSLSYMENDMARWISKKGVLPILLPDLEESLLADILHQMDGIVLQGGSDIAPQHYGEEPIGPWKGDPYRDQYELKILDYAIRNHKPVLGICRGFQLMNVYFGGTMYQDIVSQLPHSAVHRSASLYDTINHPVHIEAGTLFDRLYGHVANPLVNTVHHQAVKDLGRDLEVYARSEDGFIEAFGYIKEAAGKVMGVQWHPEFSQTQKGILLDENLIFNVFIEHAKQHRN
ncbi:MULTISPECIES: gamma-glutamyl-gamma-aminobutyrate hydrolase family protein [Sphingobacterium]|uniref:gamma-glutamyl-gamma-aminobutyrate hydrolase family protein n=1 Tax=Sphingobacterium TaxID=28453 RepID=UPI00257B2B82|nr:MULTISPECIES: gamma-glutamyl-gamma-aminobutyrate hydrolase family protein [Sphingobacterium]